MKLASHGLASQREGSRGVQTIRPIRRRRSRTSPWGALGLAVLLPWVTSATAGAADGDSAAETATPPLAFMEEITIIGSRERAGQITGSAHVLDAEHLARLGHTDIQRMVREIPGVSVQVEDGYGLRPNISIRGVATERSGRITLLEDNVLIAPAPYSAPSAYYFPTMGRMQGLEVLKGPAAILQGPYTIGGALNMISTAIPSEARGRVTIEAGADATYRVHAHYGDREDNGFGYLIEAHRWLSDGFQSIDRSNRDSGLDVADYTVKLGYAPSDSRHSVELKLQHAEQTSQQSYLGLTDADFSADPFRRYGASELDTIDTEHRQAILRYEYALADAASLSLTGYYNEHERDWFKTEGIDFDGSTSAADFSRTSWFNVVQAVNRGAELAGLTAVELQDILAGRRDTPTGSIQLRSNAREYFSRGVQLGLDWTFASGGIEHDLQFGVRYHEDEEDRLQRNSTYSQIDGRLRLDDTGQLGNAGNRVQEASAVAVHLYDTIDFGRLTISPGIRFEDIDQKRTRWETRPGRTLDPAERNAANFRSERSNHTSVWLPGVGATIDLDDRMTLVAGVHKGFTAPSNSPGVREEEAINYELGIRVRHARTSLDAIYFLSDYDNLLGECTASSGSDCRIGDAFNGDAATVQGIEFALASDLARSTAPFRLPVQLTYSFIDAQFDTDIADTDFFGSVERGDPIPYIPSHQATLSAGIQAPRFDAFVAATYVDSVCVRAACADFERTDSSLTVDASASFHWTDRVSLFGRIENLFGAEDIMGRQPYGARPNKDRTATLGLRVDL